MSLGLTIPTDITISALQLGYQQGEHPSERVSRVLDYVLSAPEADLLVLPELWDVGYFAFDRYRDIAHGLLDPPFGQLAQEARSRRCVIVAGSVLERHGQLLHNTVFAVGPDGEKLGHYRKVHLFGYLSRELELLIPGKEFVVIDTPVGRVGLATCFDLRFPIQFREMRKLGADLFVVPAAWPAARAQHWRVLLRSRAIEQQTPIVGCNGVGNCEGVELAGESLIVDAKGETMAAGEQIPGWISATLNHAETKAWREEFPIVEAERRRGRTRAILISRASINESSVYP